MKKKPEHIKTYNKLVQKTLKKVNKWVKKHQKRPK